MRNPVGIDQTVNAEVTVVRNVSEIAAVSVERRLIGIVADRNRMVGELPNASAEEFVVPLDQIPVGGKVAGPVSHSVRVFAKEERTGKTFVLDVEPFDLFKRRVHPRFQIDIIAVITVKIGITPPLRQIQEGLSGLILGVDQPRSVAGMKILRHLLMVQPAPALISDRPHNDRGVVLVAFEHPFGAIHIRFGPLGRIGQL